MTQQRLVFWVDDDSETTLRHLGRSLRRKNLQVETCDNWSEATERLKKLEIANTASKTSLLVDIILPKTASGEALSTYRGLELAEQAANMGIDRICFLTVIRLGEIAEEVNELKKRHPQVKFVYEDKLELLNPGKLVSIADFLRNGKPD